MCVQLAGEERLVARRGGELAGSSARRACWIRRATSGVTMAGREAQVEVEGRLAPSMAVRRADLLARTLQAAGRSRHRPTPKARSGVCCSSPRPGHPLARRACARPERSPPGFRESTRGLRVRSLLQEWEPAAIRLPAWGEVGGGGAVLLPAGRGGAVPG